jgi:hypothetical protein
MARRFQSGGTLREESLYVERRADRELPEALLRGDICYVFAPRQMGKSSLRARTEAVLRKRGARAVGLDLSALGSTGITPEQWYFGLIDELSRRLKLRDPARFWSSHERLPPVQRWSRFLRARVIGRRTTPVIIFLDEIDVVRSLPFPADDFFASIRALYNARADEAAWQRLNFCMMGVASPSEMMQDVTRTPFNVGRAIRLEDFTRHEALAFAEGLREIAEDPWQFLDPILGWTEGHPYMTQRICEAMAREGADRELPARVQIAHLVGELFLKRGRVEDLNLAAVERVFTRGRDRRPRQTADMLTLYRRILSEERVLAVSDDPVQAALRLTGLAAERDDGATVWLRVRNPIMASVFDDAWVSERLQT